MRIYAATAATLQREEHRVECAFAREKSRFAFEISSSDLRRDAQEDEVPLSPDQWPSTKWPAWVEARHASKQQRNGSVAARAMESSRSEKGEAMKEVVNTRGGGLGKRSSQ